MNVGCLACDGVGDCEAVGDEDAEGEGDGDGEDKAGDDGETLMEADGEGGREEEAAGDDDEDAVAVAVEEIDEEGDAVFVAIAESEGDGDEDVFGDGEDDGVGLIETREEEEGVTSTDAEEVGDGLRTGANCTVGVGRTVGSEDKELPQKILAVSLMNLCANSLSLLTSSHCSTESPESPAINAGVVRDRKNSRYSNEQTLSKSSILPIVVCLHALQYPRIGLPDPPTSQATVEPIGRENLVSIMIPQTSGHTSRDNAELQVIEIDSQISPMVGNLPLIGMN